MTGRSLPIRVPLAALTLMLTASCATVPPAPRGDDPALVEVLKGKVAQKSRSCIPLDQTRSTTIYNGAVVYTANRNLTYVSRSPGCRAMSSDPIFVVQPFGSQLCRGDTVRMVDRVSHIPGGFCILGDFTPYRTKP